MPPSEHELFRRNTLADAGMKAPPKLPWYTGITNLIIWIGHVGLLLGRTCRLFFTAKVDKGETVRIAHRFTNGSLTFVIVGMSFVGMIMVYQSTVQLGRAVGDTQLVGAMFLKLLIRVLGPTVIGLLIACRVGAGIAAEIAAMAVTDQLDAMRMCAAEPIEVLMVPRLRGGIAAAFALGIIGTTAASFAGLATTVVMFGGSAGTYWNFDLVQISDVGQGLAKVISYGFAVPIISGACGLVARGGARGVGQATTGAVVGSSFAIVVLDSIFSLLGHMASIQ